MKASGRGANRLAADDVHMAIEQRLIEKSAPRGGMLHTARSRNDQVALDERLYLRSARRVDRTGCSAGSSRRWSGKPAPTGPWSCPATPISSGRSRSCWRTICWRMWRCSNAIANGLPTVSARCRSPLGAAALAGTSFPIDRTGVARDLGLDGIVENSIDAVSDRDVADRVHCGLRDHHDAPQPACGRTRALELHANGSFIAIGEEFTTGSSIMPQKQNPDMAELVRGKTGRVYGDLMALLTVMKGLPLAYNRDMQEDKEPLFDAADTATASLRIMARMMATVTFDRDRFEEELRQDFLLATELADYLVRKGMPFRKAHGVAGEIVRECAASGLSLPDLPLERYRRFAEEFREDMYAVLDPRASVARKRSAGSTSPQKWKRRCTRWEKKLSMIISLF